MSRSGRWRVWILMLALTVLVAFAACGSQTTPRATTTATPTAVNGQDLSPSPTPAPISTVTPTPLPSSTAVPVPTATPAPGIPPAPLASGRVILVSLSLQRLYAYQDGALSFTFPVETGRPQLPTPTGVFHVFLKNCSDLRWTSNSAPSSYHNANCVEHNGDGHQAMFTSPWPKGSPYWYSPTHINYALEFKEGGFYLHDAWWHVAFGPGANTPHQLPDGSWETGSHGCIGMSILDASRLYAWAPLGTPVYVRTNV